MPLTRDERKLLHQKSKQPTLGTGKPDNSQGNEGDITFRKVQGSGTVQFLKQDGSWVAISSSGTMPSSRGVGVKNTSQPFIASNHDSLIGLGDDDHTQYLLIDGTRAMTGNLNMGTNDIGSVGALDVDGATTLDKTTINTADGSFTVNGSNPIVLTTTSTDANGNLDINVGFNYELDVTRTCDWNTSIIDWDNGSTFTLTSVGDVTIETSGADTAKTILLFNDNNNASAFRGIHLKTDSGSVGSSQNSIFLECDNRSSKGGGDGIDIRSEDGILIRAEDPTTGTASNIQIRATNHIDLQGGTASISPTGDSITRVKVHGITEIVQLYRPSGSSITTNLETITTPFGGSPETGHTEFEAINTQHLLRAITYKASGTVTNGNTLTIVSNANDDNIAGTVWQISVVYYYSSSKINFQMFYVYFTAAAGSVYNDIVTDVNDTNGGSTAGSLSWDSSNGIRWTNNDSQDAIVKASALRIQSGNDFL